jgi:hypothetical protein
MVSGKMVSIGQIMYKVLRNPLCNDLSYEQCAEYALEYLKLIGAPLSLESIVSDPPIEIENHKALLPNNIFNIRGVRYMGEEICKKGKGIPMVYGSGIYKNELDGCDTNYSYVVNACVIQTSVKEGFLEVSYTAVAQDKEGYPLIPDNESFKKGLEYYVLHLHLEPLWMMGKIQDKVFQYIEQKRHFYTGQASTSLMVKNLDHLETMMSSVNRMIIDRNPQQSSYNNFGIKEQLYRH